MIPVDRPPPYAEWFDSLFTLEDLLDAFNGVGLNPGVLVHVAARAGKPAWIGTVVQREGVSAIIMHPDGRKRRVPYQSMRKFEPEV